MRIGNGLLALSLVLLTACSTARPRELPGLFKAKDSPETVLITCHVKPRSEEELQALFACAWGVYRQEHLVHVQPHVVLRGGDNGDQLRFVEILTWVSHKAPEHVSDSIKQLWEQEQSMCAARDGHPGVEGGEVGVILAELPGTANQGRSGK